MLKGYKYKTMSKKDWRRAVKIGYAGIREDGTKSALFNIKGATVSCPVIVKDILKKGAK